jgi:glycosyltransferase involved in cell wall biosynthesis
MGLMESNLTKSRILAYCYEFPPIGGGAGNALFHMAREWVRSGHEVTIVTTGYKALSKDYSLDGVRVLRLPCGRKRMSQGRIPEMIRFMLLSAIKTRQYHHQFKPDLCIAFMTLPSGLGPCIMNLLYKTPYITALRGGDVPGFDPKSMRFYHFFCRPLIRYIWKKSQALVANGAGLASLANKFEPLRNINIVSNGVDIEHFTPNMSEKSPNSYRLIYAGRFSENQKQIATIIKALQGVKNAELWLIGDGPDKAKYQALVEELGLEDRVVFAGWLKGANLLKAYQSAHVYISASRYEGMPNAALEAMACGLVPILSDIPGHRELVRHGVNGYLFSPYQMTEATQYLNSLQTNCELRHDMSLNCRRIVLSQYQWKKIANKYLQLFFNTTKPTSSLNVSHPKQKTH